jgi:hypothetical protein
MYQKIWSFLLSGCSINRDTAKYLKQAGSWDTIDLRRKDGEVGWEVMGYVVGQ